MPKLLLQDLDILSAGSVKRMKHERYAFILIADKKYWNRLRIRNKANRRTYTFVRKSQVAPKNAQKLLFYVTKPIMQVRGAADFVEQLTGDREEIWRKYGAENCFENFE